MKVTLSEDTWPYIDEFFKKMPENLKKLPTFQELLSQTEQKGEIKNAQNTLLRQLNRKFGELPLDIQSHIQKTIELKQLEQWLDEIIFAEKIEHIEWHL